MKRDIPASGRMKDLGRAPVWYHATVLPRNQVFESPI